MQVLILVSRDQFDDLMNQMHLANLSDYYTVGSGQYDRRLPVSDLAIDRMLPVEKEFVEVSAHMHTKSVCKGYTFLNNEQGCCYRTSGGNVYGAYRYRPDNTRPNYVLHYAFYSGRRSRVADLVNILFEEYRKISAVQYSTTGPRDMKWYETLSDYLVRKGSDCAVRYFAKTGVDGDLGQEEHTALTHYKARDPEFVSKVYATMMEGMDPEKIILDTFRNKKVVPETMDPKTAAAWQLLPQEVQHRILRWS